MCTHFPLDFPCRVLTPCTTLWSRSSSLCCGKMGNTPFDRSKEQGARTEHGSKDGRTDGGRAKQAGRMFDGNMAGCGDIHERGNDSCLVDGIDLRKGLDRDAGWRTGIAKKAANEAVVNIPHQLDSGNVTWPLLLARGLAESELRGQQQRQQHLHGFAAVLLVSVNCRLLLAHLMCKPLRVASYDPSPPGLVHRQVRGPPHE